MTQDKPTAAGDRVLRLLAEGFTVTRARPIGRGAVRPAKAWKRMPDGHYVNERVSDATLEALKADGYIEHQRHEATIYVRLAERQESLPLDVSKRRA